MLFTEMRDLLIEHFNRMTEDKSHLFFVSLDKDALYNLYLDSFKPEENKIFRKRRAYDCSCCRGFIKNIGNVISIKNNKVETIWDFETNDEVFQPVLNALSAYVKEFPIENVFLSKENKIGCHHNFEEMISVGAYRWDHFYLELPSKYVVTSNHSKEELLSQYRDTRNVFMRSLDEISLDAIDTVLDIIYSNSLYKGDEWKKQLEKFKDLKKAYSELNSYEKNLFTWEMSASVGTVLGRIRNHSIGTLLTNLSEGMDLDVAVKKYEQITAPSNYKRSKPIYTQKMLDDAQKTITDLGYLDSLARRYARLDDITINDILFSNKDAAKKLKNTTDIFGELSKTVKTTTKKFDNIQEVSVDTFISEILPGLSDIELYLDNKLVPNMVSLIAPINQDSKSMFKWNNNFSWAYSGNMTDSMMKERVKSAGGSVDGDLRFSIQWNDIGSDHNDLDAHCITPFTEIYYGHKLDNKTHGKLDVDIIYPENQVAVENITWGSRENMKPGQYKFFVNQFNNRGGKDGFRAEIEFDGHIYSYDYPHELRQNENINVATVTLDNNGNFTIKEELQSSISSKTVWNVQTNNFIPVTVICYSPNHWNNSKPTGHKHLLFMLQDCINNERPSGMFNEFLVQELYEHRKVMEALGSKLRVEDSDEQLSGVGFALDKRAEVVLKVKGAVEGTYKIKF